MLPTKRGEQKERRIRYTIVLDDDRLLGTWSKTQSRPEMMRSRQPRFLGATFQLIDVRPGCECGDVAQHLGAKGSLIRAIGARAIGNDE